MNTIYNTTRSYLKKTKNYTDDIILFALIGAYAYLFWTADHWAEYVYLGLSWSALLLSVSIVLLYTTVLAVRQGNKKVEALKIMNRKDKEYIEELSNWNIELIKEVIDLKKYVKKNKRKNK